MNSPILSIEFFAQMGIVLGQPWNLLFAGAAVIPIVIHLWSQQQRHEEPWAAIQFLNQALLEEQSKLFIHTWILLLTRIAAILLFAIAMAHPQLPGQTKTQSSSKRPTAPTFLVVDASYSMQFQGERQSRIDQARSDVEKYFQSNLSDSSDEIFLIRMANSSEVVAQGVLDDPQLKEALGRIETEAMSARIEPCLMLLSSLIEQTANFAEPCKIVFFSDLQTITWSNLSSPTCQSIVTSLQENGTLSIVSHPLARANNLFISRLDVPMQFITTERDIRFEFDIQHETLARQRVQSSSKIFVSIFVDGELKSKQPATLTPNSSLQQSFTHRFARPGYHRIEVRISDDQLNLDNRRYLSIRVPTQLRVALIGDSSSSMRYLRSALESAAQSFDVRVSLENQFNWARSAIDQNEMLIFTDVEQFTASEAETLQAFISRGGSCVFFVSDRMNLQNWNQTLGNQGINLLPAELLEIQDTDSLFFQISEPDHPLLYPFTQTQDSGLTQVPVWKYIAMSPNRLDKEPSESTVPKSQTTASPQQTRIPLQFTNGAPAMLTTNRRNGNVTLFAFSVSDFGRDSSVEPWTAWPLSPTFAPMIYQLGMQAMQPIQRRLNLECNEPIELNDSAGTKRKVASLVTDKGRLQTQVTIRYESTPSATMNQPISTSKIAPTDTRRPGFYAVYTDPHAIAPHELFAVNLDARESLLAPLPTNQLPNDFRVLTEADLQAPLDATLTGPDLTYRWALLIVLTLMIGESVLAWHFGRQS